MAGIHALDRGWFLCRDVFSLVARSIRKSASRLDSSTLRLAARQSNPGSLPKCNRSIPRPRPTMTRDSMRIKRLIQISLRPFIRSSSRHGKLLPRRPSFQVHLFSSPRQKIHSQCTSLKADLLVSSTARLSILSPIPCGGRPTCRRSIRLEGLAGIQPRQRCRTTRVAVPHRLLACAEEVKSRLFLVHCPTEFPFASAEVATMRVHPHRLSMT